MSVARWLKTCVAALATLQGWPLWTCRSRALEVGLSRAPAGRRSWGLGHGQARNRSSLQAAGARYACSTLDLPAARWNALPRSGGQAIPVPLLWGTAP